MPAVGTARVEFVGGHQVFQLAHHAAQRVLVRLQGIWCWRMRCRIAQGA